MKIAGRSFVVGGLVSAITESSAFSGTGNLFFSADAKAGPAGGAGQPRLLS